MLRNQEIGISQQNADASTKRAEASMINATKPPAPGKGPAYSTGTYNQKIAAAMKAVPTLFNQAGAKGKNKNRVNYAFGVLWAQMAPYVSAANKAKARQLLRQRIAAAAKGYTPDTSGGGGDRLVAGASSEAQPKPREDLAKALAAASQWHFSTKNLSETNRKAAERTTST